MKCTFALLATWLIGTGLLLTAQAQLEVGSSSDITAFSLFESGGSLTSAALDQFEGKIILAYYYTPW